MSAPERNIKEENKEVMTGEEQRPKAEQGDQESTGTGEAGNLQSQATEWVGMPLKRT